MTDEYKSLNAVHVDDLDNFLDAVGLLTGFKAKALKCKFCKNVVTKENIYSVISDSNQYKLVCSKAQCVAALMDFIAEKQTRKIADE